MAIQTIYLLNTAATAPDWFGKVQDNGTAPAGALSAFGWTVAKTAITTPYWRGRIGATARSTVAQAASWIDAQTRPVPGTGNAATTAGDSFRSDAPLNGTFAAGNWNFTFGMRTGAASNAGRVRCIMWASVNADGSSARKLTSATLVGTIITLSTTTTTYNSTVTWAAPQVVLTNEYLFLQVEWLTTTVGTSNSCTAQFYQASFVTTDYVYAPATGPLAVVETADIAAFVGTVTSAGPLAATEAADVALFNGTVANQVFSGPLVAVEAEDTASFVGDVSDSLALDYLRPDGDTALNGWTDHSGGTSNIYQAIDEASANDADFIQSPLIVSADLSVRLLEGSTEIAEWTHTDIGDTFVTAEQTLTAPQFAAISNFGNLFIELDDNSGHVYRAPLSNPSAGIEEPVKLSYRYKKAVE